jgi:hypothetical protein
MAIRVFISHSHEDHTLSEAVASLLRETLGLRDDEILNTSHASTGLMPGSMVPEGLGQAMAAAEVCLVLITPASGERPWVQFEAGGAYFGKKRLYTLLHPSAKSPNTLPNNPTLIDRAEETAQLIDAVRGDLDLHVTASTAKTIEAVSRFIGEVKAYNPEYMILHYENRLELQIGYGDVFEWPGPGAIALACDNRFDLVKEGEGSQLAKRTLIGQFRTRFLKHLSTDDFRKYMVSGLGGSESEIDHKFEVGHVSVTPFTEGATDTIDRRMLFLVVLYTVMDRNGIIEGAADAPDVWRAYESLWTAAAHHRPEAVAAPIFGPGQSGALLSRQQSCALAVLSAVCVALRQPIYPRLLLLCHDRDCYRALNLRAIAEAVGLEHGPRP